MAKYRFLSFSLLACILLTLNTSLRCNAAEEYRKDYIVYLGSLPEGDYSPSSHHISLLQELVEEDSFSETLLIRSYKRSFNGFAAKLTSQEAQNLARRKEVVSVFPSTPLKLQTTESWDFMGFNESLSRSAGMGSDIIVGVIDSGVWPESESFSDEGYGTPPQKWKGVCQGGKNFTCNKKLIGARYYRNRYVIDSARDFFGHGTHTASTAAGNIVKDVSFFGLASGSARGGLPSARIAVYTVCGRCCDQTSILGAFDDAIADGVDVITISLGFGYISHTEYDAIAIGAFHAMIKGILTVHSAGNDGPEPGVIGSVVPWEFSVAASTTDRRLITRVVLDNGKTLIGTSLNSFTLNGTVPLIHGKDAADSSCSEAKAGSCLGGCLNRTLVEGKILLCEVASGTNVAENYGAFGVITPRTSDVGLSSVAFIVPFPAVRLSPEDFNVVKSYVTSTKNPRGEILKSEAIKDTAAPVVASFSSRGPNRLAPDILKPDITAPGVDILAAYSPAVALTSSPDDKRRVKYSVMSGTSMAGPHVAGVAAYVKAFHPHWSPSAIKSAIMTTAWPMNASKNPEGEFAYGSGHIDPVKAVSPGLVYEASKDDYVNFLCSLGYDVETVRKIAGKDSSCPPGSSKGSPKDLNYPSMTAKVSLNESFKVVFNRTVTNVGLANSTYKAEVFSSSKLKITVVPDVLSFKSLKENKSYTVTVSGGSLSGTTMESASLVWSDGQHRVRSPIVVY